MIYNIVPKKGLFVTNGSCMKRLGMLANIAAIAYTPEIRPTVSYEVLFIAFIM